MKRVFALVLLVVAAFLSFGCSENRYEPEPVGTSPAAVPAASAPSGGLEIPGLVEWGRSWYGAKSNVGRGKLVIQGDRLEWTNLENSDRSFAIRTSVVSAVSRTCAARPGQNLCLEIGFRTLTDLEYQFRDENWAGGDNQGIQKLYDYLKANYTHIRYEEKTVEKVD